jgi:hypothetical protein
MPLAGQFLMDELHLPGLINVYKKLWKDPPFLMGKLTISTGPCSIANC